MHIRIAAALGLFAALLTGCSSTPPAKPEPVETTVTVTLPNGKPGADLNLLMLPGSTDQNQGGGKTDANGKVKTKLTPGKYTVVFDNAPAAVPKKYHSNDPTNTVDVPATGGDIAVKLTN